LLVALARVIDGRGSALEEAAHRGNRLFAVVGNGHMVAVFVNDDGFVAVRGLRERSENGDGFRRTAETDGR
jgi:hypothetical protein